MMLHGHQIQLIFCTAGTKMHKCLGATGQAPILLSTIHTF